MTGLSIPCILGCMKKPSKPLPRDSNKLAHEIVRLSTEEPEEPQTEKSAISKYLSEIGRKGGLKGGKVRAENLTPQQRSAIAKIAASARWGNIQPTRRNERMALKWRKRLTKSDAQQETRGAKMPFLRLTKGGISEDHTTWFREEFFEDAGWKRDISRDGHSIEVAQIKIHVVLVDNDLGERTMRIDHDPARAGNHKAPTTHLHYDAKTRQALEANDLSEHWVVVERGDSGKYSLTVRERYA